MRSASSVGLTPSEIFQLIAADLEKVEEKLKETARCSLPLVDQINRYLHDSGGKRLRPALLLLSSRLSGHQGEAAVNLGVVVELIHVATLVHDDIIDDAEVRRGRPSVKSMWGNEITVLMGDWLYMTAFQLSVQQRDFRVLDLLIDITRNMVEGELLQLEQSGKLDVSAEQHLNVCHRKTAALFAACGRLGAMLGLAGQDAEERLATYGRCLGMAFQLTDDLLDYTASADVLGKPVLKDLEEGKITLPIIYLMKRASDEDGRQVRRIVETADFGPQSRDLILRLVQDYGALQDLQALAASYAERAKNSLMTFPDSIYRQAMLTLPDLVIERKK